MSEAPEPAPELEETVDRGRRWLSGISENAIVLGADIAHESDRWFLLAVHGVGHGARSVREGLGAVARVVSERSARWRPRWTRPRSGRERIQEALEQEARRLDFDVSREEFTAFSEKMAQLLELIFTGALSLNDVAFEPAESEAAPGGAEPAPASPAPESVEVAEEVPDQKQRNQPEERKPLSVG